MSRGVDRAELRRPALLAARHALLGSGFFGQRHRGEVGGGSRGRRRRTTRAAAGGRAGLGGEGRPAPVPENAGRRSRLTSAHGAGASRRGATPADADHQSRPVHSRSCDTNTARMSGQPRSRAARRASSIFSSSPLARHLDRHRPDHRRRGVAGLPAGAQLITEGEWRAQFINDPMSPRPASAWRRHCGRRCGWRHGRRSETR